MKMAFIAPNGKYLCAELDGAVYANRTDRGAWETWTAEQADGWQFRSDHGQYLRAELGGGDAANALGPDRSAWQTWTGDLSHGSTALRAVDGVHYLGVGLGDLVHAASRVPVLFRIEIVEADAPVQKAPSLSRLHVEGQDFVTAEGRRHVVVGSTELLLAHKYDIQGADSIDAILSERHALGFNNLRCLLQKDIRNAGVPWQMPLDKIAPFLGRCARFGFYVQATILADCQVVNPPERLQQQRVENVRSATTGLENHIEQLGNEWFKNGFDPRHFSRSANRLATLASGMNVFADDPVWDFFTFSGDREPAQKGIREYGPIEAMYRIGKPAICDEGMVPGENSSDPRDFERAGAQARSGCGGRFHHRAGSNRTDLYRLFTPLERECAAAFVAGMRG